MKAKCIKSTYSCFVPGEVYEFREIGTAGRYRVFEMDTPEGYYTFGLDEAGSNETDGNFMQFELGE